MFLGRGGRPFSVRCAEGSRGLGHFEGEREHKGRSDGRPLPLQTVAESADSSIETRARHSPIAHTM